MTDYNILWQMTNFDRLQQIMSDYDVLWQIMTDYGRLWQIMVNYDRLWHIMINLCSVLLVYLVSCLFIYFLYYSMQKKLAWMTCSYDNSFASAKSCSYSIWSESVLDLGCSLLVICAFYIGWNWILQNSPDVLPCQSDLVFSISSGPPAIEE